MQAGPGQALVIAQRLDPTQQVLARLGIALPIVGGIGVLVAALAGVAVARAGLRPVDRLTAATERVAATGELRPIPVDGSRRAGPAHPQLQRDAAAPGRLPGAAAPPRRRRRARAAHPADLDAHQPGAARLGRAGPARPTLPEADRAEILEDVQAQVAELSTLVGDLVELARDDAPQVVHETLELTDVVERALERARRRAGDVEFVPTLVPWTLVGDSTALERAVLNLLDNAAKWSPPGGPVRVQMRPLDDWSVLLEVADAGPGHRRGGPAAGVRPLLPRRHLPHDARLRARAGHRPAGGGAARRRGLGRTGAGGRRAAGHAAARPAVAEPV